MVKLSPRRTLYRLGRALYRAARGDVANDMGSNGELLLQRKVIEAWGKIEKSTDRLVVFDVGANVGKWSAELVERCTDHNIKSAIELYVFEPSPSTFDLLKKKLRGSPSVIHYEQLALSSENSKGFIYVSRLSHGINSLHADPGRADEQRIPVMKTTVSDFCKNHNIKNIHMLKCDAEGHDMEIIRGAMELLISGSIAVLQFEYNHRWVFFRNFLRDVFIAVEKLPYKVAKLQPDHLVILPEWHPELEKFFEGNYALIRADAVYWFPTKTVLFDRYNTMEIIDN